MSDEAVEAFREVVVSWALDDHAWGQSVIDAASDALVAGLDSPALRSLAGLYPDTAREVLLPTVDDACSELGVTIPEGQTALRRHVLRRHARAVIDGLTPPRELATWAHSHDSQSGDQRALSDAMWDYELLDDLTDYDAAGAAAYAEALAKHDAYVRQLAHDLLAGPS